ncbi:MAG: hypothetical protein II916_09990 [Oscillospiraceae bacterium]|nr:hypothetical protein [Oscillospiraceae bacterium]
MKTRHRMAALLAVLSMVLTAAPAIPVSADYGVGGTGNNIVEYLDRGIYAIKSGDGMYISWRYNANDSDDAEFRLFRGSQLIYTSKAGDPTCFWDASGNAKSQYRVDMYHGDKLVTSDLCRMESGTNYIEIPLNKPGNSYTANDCSCGDVDGDGQYEIILKWDPSNSKDNSQSGYTDNVYIDCYTLDGKQLWRIDMGKNIRAGQHYTQMCVADFDCDGKAELITKTADGTKDGTGKVIGDGSKDYRNSGGYILAGPEYITLFDGLTGAALDTQNYPVPRGEVSKKTWGDDYGNRVDRMNGAIAYLDGVHPSAVYGRGYYTRLTLSAFDVRDKKLVKRWVYDTGFNTGHAGYGCGNHNVMVADVDNDGKQEVCMGASMIDDDGKLLWSTRQMHGDAMHMGDLDPDHEGMEVWICHEDKPYGVSLLDAKTGNKLFHFDADKDTGRCCGDNVCADNPGAELWGARPANTVLDVHGKTIGSTVPAMNFLIYWDGDLEREILSGTTISKMVSLGKIQDIFNAEGCVSINSTKAVPNMTGDLLGDWREEVVFATSDSTKLRVYCTNTPTDVRLTTLMHDVHYRMQVGCQQSSYNQPPHTSYYLGSEAPLPMRPNVNVLGADSLPEPTEPPLPDLTEPEAPDDFIYGDVNFDGEVDVFDMALMKRHLLHDVFGRNALRRGDVDADGKVGVVDAIALQKYLMTGEYVPAFANKTGFAYAIDQQINKGVHEDYNTGYMDEAYVNLDNEIGSSLEWTVFAQEDGNYLCTFGTANGSASNRQMKVEVNDGADYWMQDFLSTESWTTWQERGIVLPLHKGRNTVRLTSATAEGGPNFDYLKTEWTDEPAAETVGMQSQSADPIQQNQSRTIYIAGDSTVQTYKASAVPPQGWGAFLGENMPEGVAVSNHAIAGRSSKSFYDNGRLTTILDNIREGDYLLVQFGINDAASNKAERYAPTCGKVPGTAGSFEDYMAKYIEGAKAKGATPVMVTTVIGLKAYSGGKFVGSYGNYCDAMKKLANYYQIPCIDLNTLMVNHYNSIGYDAAYKYHMVSTGNGSTDMTHFTEAGAKAVAKLVADDMKRQGLV